MLYRHLRLRALFCYAIVAGCDSFTVAIAGANGGLGRELTVQSLERDWNVLAATRRPEDGIMTPTRNAWLDEGSGSGVKIPNNTRLKVVDYTEIMKSKYDALVISLGGKPFMVDNSDIIVKSLCENVPRSCKCACLVSAYGAGDSLDEANAGIRVMNSWYLRDVYRSKNKQEDYVNALCESVETLVLRPRVLSYGPVPFNDVAIPREEFAERILNWISR